MKNLLIFAIIVLFGCSEEHERKRICSPFRMTISDAIPVQFWVNGVETYNQKEVCGITQACFCQPFNCDDEIRIQFQDDGAGLYALIVYDSTGTEITSLSFTEVATDVFELSFVPSELDVCNESIRLEIKNIFTLLNEEFNSSEYWENRSTGSTFTISGGAANTSFISGQSPYDTKDFTQNISIEAGSIVTFTTQYTVSNLSAGTGRATMRVHFYSGGSVIQTNNMVQTIGVGTHSQNVTDVVVPAGVDGIAFSVLAVNPDEYDLSVDFFRMSDTETILAVSDCIDIKTSHECTALIRYDNSKDFADIDYTDFSPTAEFYLRIPAVFFHETNPSEQENFETSGQTIVRLRNEIKIKRLLEVGFMPDYMHRKLMLILAQDTVEIDGETWVQQDVYEKPDPTNKRYPLKKASVLLTQQGYIKRNIL